MAYFTGMGFVFLGPQGSSLIVVRISILNSDPVIYPTAPAWAVYCFPPRQFLLAR